MLCYTYIACLVCAWHNHSDPLSFTKSASLIRQSNLALLIFARYFFQFLVGQISLFILLLSDHLISYSAVTCILYLVNLYTFSFSLPAWSRGQTFQVATLKFMGFLALLVLSLFLFLTDKHLSSDDSSCITVSLQLGSSGIAPIADDSLNCFSYYSLYKICFS